MCELMEYSVATFPPKRACPVSVLVRMVAWIHGFSEYEPTSANFFYMKYLEYVSQQSTFLYSPRTRIQSSRLDAWSVQDVIQAGRSVRPPSPGKVSAPLRMRVDTSSYAGACVVKPSEKAL